MKLKFTGLFLVPAALIVACGPNQAASAPAAPAHLAPAVTHSVKPTPATPRQVPKSVTTTASAACHFRYENGNPLPDPACTPGAVQSTSVTAVCTPGWATAHRVYFTKAEREAAFAKYGVITANPAGYGEYDHLIPLELGGSNAASNLWPEKGKIPNPKDAVENALHEAVCSGKVPLRMAQQAIAADWVTADTKVITSGPPVPAPVSKPMTTTAAPAPAPKPATTTASAGCSPKTSGGNCYRAGELCPAADHGMSGTSASGATITCEDNNGWRWE